MKERLIIFSGPSVRAIQAGRKTMTRRVMKPQPPDWVTEFGWTAFTPPHSISGRGRYQGELAEKFFPAPYERGMRLWVRETFRELGSAQMPDGSLSKSLAPGHMIYRADGHEYDGPWRSPIVMPRWASRITLEVIAVRVERVQDISETDAIAEGCRSESHSFWTGFQRIRGNRVGLSVGAGLHGKDPAPEWMECAELETIAHSAKDDFMGQWNHLNSKRGYGWAENSWVWVVQFRRLEAGC